MSGRILLVAALLSAAPAAAGADTIDATATTLLAGRQDPRDGTVHTVVPFYETLSLQASDLRNPWFSDTRIVVAAWGLLQAGDPLDGTTGTGDVDLAYVEGRTAGRRLTLRAGRQLVFGGAARALQLDGLDARARLVDGVGVEVYGGVPTTPRFASDQGDAVAGGRLFYRPSPRLEAGASFVHVLGQGRTERQEAGFDLRVAPAPVLTIAVLSLFSTVEERLAEAALQAIWQPLRTVELTLEAARTAPDLLIPRGSIFSVFAEQTRDEAGGVLYLRPLTRLRLVVDGHAIDDDSGLGGRAGARASLALGRDHATTLGAELRLLELPTKGLLDARTFAVRRLTERLVTTLELSADWLDPAVNGQDRSLTGVATLGWDFAPGWRGVVTGVAGETPLLERRLEILAKLVYQATLRVREVRP